MPATTLPDGSVRRYADTVTASRAAAPATSGTGGVPRPLPVGAELAYLLAKMKPVFDHTKKLEAVTGRLVLDVVSLTTIEAYQASLNQGFLRYVAVAGALVFVAVMVVAITTAGLLGPA